MAAPLDDDVVDRITKMPTVAAANSIWRSIPLVLLTAASVAIFISSPAQGQPLPVVVALAERLGDDDPAVRQATVAALRAMGPLARPAIPAVARRVRDRDCYIRIDAAHVLEQFGADSVPALTDLLQDADPHVRELAARTLQRIGPVANAAIPALVQHLSDENVSVRQVALAALRAMGMEARPAIPAIAQRLRDSDAYIRMDAARTLVALGPVVVPAVTPLLHDPSPRVRELSARTLQQIATETIPESPAAAR
jgi:HEAT repeat protein